jgi:F420-dependent oxidoreductase-like protein
MKIGIFAGGGESTLEQAVERIVQAERDGFASAWLANIFALDALTVLALAGRETSRIELGTAVVPTYPRHPHSLAQQAATVNAACGGRLSLGIGRSHKLVIEDMLGLTYDKPIGHMRDYLEVLRSLSDTGNCAYTGDQYTVNAPLQVEEGVGFGLFVGALMPRMLELCGQLCEGTLTWMSGPKHIEKNIAPVLNAAASAAGRPAPRVIASLPVCVTSDETRAREEAARLFTIYGSLPVYRACMDEEGVDGPADLALVGDAGQVKEAINRVRDAGATDFYPAVFPSGVEGEDSERASYDLMASLGGEV